MNPFLKILISALMIWAVSEIAKRNLSFAALIASLPLVSVLAMIWMYHDSQGSERIVAFSGSVVWYVLPSLILFALLPVCLKTWKMAFYPALAISCASTILGFLVLKFVLGRFQIQI